MVNLLTNTISLQEILESINTLPDAGGVELPKLTNEGPASDLLAGKQLIDQEGNIVEGTIANNTSSNMTASGATVTAPAGYYASAQSKSVATATQATPSISVDTAGKITASATQTAGYVSAGTKSATKQLTVQAAQTITPGTTNKTIASGRYLTGTQTIKGDANLVAENIKSGVSIFGVTGSYEGSTTGSGSGSVQSCQVSFTNPDMSLEGVRYTAVENGVAVLKILDIDTLAFDYENGGTITVAKNSLIYMEASDWYASLYSDQAALYYHTSGMAVFIFEVTDDIDISFFYDSSEPEEPSIPFG